MVKRIIGVKAEEIFQGEYYLPQRLFFYEVSDLPQYRFIDIQIPFL